MAPKKTKIKGTTKKVVKTAKVKKAKVGRPKKK